MDLIQNFTRLSVVPKYLKKRGKASRALNLLDFVRPVETNAEKELVLREASPKEPLPNFPCQGVGAEDRRETRR